MNIFLPATQLVICILFLEFICPISSTAEKSYAALSQTMYFHGGYDQRLSGDSSLAEGFMLLKSKGSPGDSKSEIYSFGVLLSPVAGVTILGGSIASSGLISHAKNPVFRLDSPFFTPSKPRDTQVLSLGSSQKTENLACEISLNSSRLIVFTDTAEKSENRSGLLLSRFFPRFFKSGTSLSSSLFCGYYRSGFQVEDSWFFNPPELPPRKVFFPAMEIQFQNEHSSGSFTGLMEISRLKKPAKAIRSDASVQLHFMTLAGGIYLADTSFTPMKNSQEMYLRRLFLAPSIEIPSSSNTKNWLRWGMIFGSDILRQNEFYSEETHTISMGTALDAFMSKSSMRLKLMKKEKEFDVTIEGKIMEALLKGFAIEANARLQNAKTTVAASFAFNRKKSFHTAVGTERFHAFSNKDPVYSVWITTDLHLYRKLLDWNLSGKIAVKNDRDSVTGSLYLQTLLH